MRVWVIKVGEPLPTDEGANRLMRTGMLAEQLVQSGHDVTWWTSSFDHNHKQHRTSHDEWVNLGPKFRICMMQSAGYRANVSLGRLRDHQELARKFAAQAQHEEKPDVILCSLPTLELCDEAVAYGRRVNRPVVLDVRDLWPDLFLDLAPRFARPIANWAIRPLARITECACAGATAIVGPTDKFVDWGVQKAGRSRTAADRVFPMGYEGKVPTQEKILAATEYWRQFQIGQETDKFVGCFFGSINRHFEIPTVIQAAKLLAAAKRDVRFVICGKGDKLSKWKELAQGCPQVVFPGWVNTEKIWTLMRCADVGLAPYVSCRNFVDNLPNKPIEYLSAGLPIVSSLQGVLSEILERNDCGVTYENKSAQGLANCVMQLMDAPDALRRMGGNALRLFQQNYMAENVYRGMADYLAEIAEGRQRLAA